MAVRGQIRIPEDVSKEVLSLKEPEVVKNGLPLNTSDIYKELGLRGYDYKGIFRGIKTIDNYGKIIYDHISKAYSSIVVKNCFFAFRFSC